MAGITNKVSTNENKTPPTITIPRGCRLEDAAPIDNARGNEPKAIYGNFMYGDSTLWKTVGTLTITRFDDKGIAGSFSLQAEDRLQPRTLKIEGSFDMPCRGGMVEGGCRANKAIRDE